MIVYVSKEIYENKVNNYKGFRTTLELIEALEVEIASISPYEKEGDDNIVGVGERQIGATTAILYCASQNNIPVVSFNVEYHKDIAKNLGYDVKIFKQNDPNLLDEIENSGGKVLKDTDVNTQSLREKIRSTHNIIGFDYFNVCTI